MPEKGYSGANGMAVGCCQDDPNFCFNLPSTQGCASENVRLDEVCNESTGLCEEPPPVVSSVPTLSEWGLIAMAVVLGIVGFMVMRRRKVTA